MVRQEVRKRNKRDLRVEISTLKVGLIMGFSPFADKVVPSSAISCFFALSRPLQRLKLNMFVSRCNLEALEGAPRVFWAACTGAGAGDETLVLLPGCLRFLLGGCVENVDMPGRGATPFVAAVLTVANPFWGGGADFKDSSCATDALLEGAATFFGLVFGILPAASISRSSSRSSA